MKIVFCAMVFLFILFVILMLLKGVIEQSHER